VPRTALIIEVPEAEPFVHDWRLRYDNASLGVPAHVTLLFPFVAAEHVDDILLDELRRLFAEHEAFAFSLMRLEEFPDETVWLAPDPDEPFRRLTAAIAARYPDYPPYEGIHDEVIPHLTVTSGDASLRTQLEPLLAPHLPIAAEAGEVTLLVENEDGHWRAGTRFALGAGGTPEA
jgi:2'-5' RNA ligase